MIHLSKTISITITHSASFLNGQMKHVLLFLLCFFPVTIALCQSPHFFDADEVIVLNLRGDLKALFKDRGEDPQYHPLTLQYKTGLDSINIPVRIKTRGHFRKLSSNCKYPPLWLNFKKSTIPQNSIFEGLDKVKLVTPCQAEKYVIHEYLVYKLYNLITPKSFKARLVKVIFQDTVKNKSSEPFYTILLEEEKQMAMRNQSTSIEHIGLRPEVIQKEDFLKMAVFEYLIGNTDWSIQFQQNIKLIKTDSVSLPIAIPYDFDHAGIVRAPYANPAPELKLRSTLERRYRGYCMPEMGEFTAVFETFNQLKADIYALYDGNPLLSSSYQRRTLKFLDDFYETINDPKKARKAFSYPCDKSGTGNIVIKGLKQHE